ncbi:type II toxin-antitoxin system RelE/ParE family toxin [Gracilibacillus massiliensis]|uniref:type II toxin-antitoxin system RelE/ParE family toxin n=1 Tax=Gracilibacillus massiliensis TaxID=1564956 RepID=UPI00071CF84E|nr:type II toxin-antitoxin system RelE/ParE family toxin [Gracilibacillus massiliensis]
MNVYHLVITNPAETDLKGIADYIAKELQESATAQLLVSKIAEAIYKLEHVPKRYPLVRDERLANQGIRKMMVENYIVFYTVSQDNQVVTIIRILYSRRNWLDLL